MNTTIIVFRDRFVLDYGDDSHLRPNPPFLAEARFAIPLMYKRRFSQRASSSLVLSNSFIFRRILCLTSAAALFLLIVILLWGHG